MDSDISFKEAKSLVCLFPGNVDMFGPREVVAMVTPKYFAAETLSSSTLFRMYLVFKGFTFLWFGGPGI